jgi:hypothetical protein
MRKTISAIRAVAEAVNDLAVLGRDLTVGLLLIFGPSPRCRSRCPWEPSVRCVRPPTHLSEEHLARGGAVWRDWDNGLAALIKETRDVT